MKKISTLILSLVFLAIIFVTNSFGQDAKLKMFVRTGCPHCAKVEEFLSKNNLSDKVELIDTYNNEANAKAFEDAAKKYGLASDTVGVPFLVVDDTTYKMGDAPIIEYFGQKYNIDTTNLTQYNSSTSDMVFLGIGGAALLAIIGYGIYTAVSKKK